MSDDATLDEFADSGKTGTNQEVPPPTELTGVTDDWANVRLAKVAKSDDGAFVDGPFGSNLKADEMHTEGYARVIQLQNIRESEFVDTNHRYISEEKFEELSRHGAEAGDLAIAKMSEPVARACLLPDIEDQYLVVADCIKLSVDESAHNSQFVMLALNSRSVWKQAFARSRGSTRKRINLTQLKEVQIPSPPLSEQRKIATVLHTVDQAIQKTEEIIDQSWRVKKGILQNLLTEGYDDHQSYENYRLGPLELVKPEGWDLRTFNDFSYNVQDGPHITPDYVDEGIPFVSSQNVNPFRDDFDYSEYEKYISQKVYEEINQNCRPDKSDLIISRRATIGPTQLIRHDKQFAFFVGVAIIKTDDTVHNPFLEQLLNWSVIEKLWHLKSPGSTMKTLNLGTIKDQQIPLPPLEEQKSITEVFRSIDKNIINNEKYKESLERTKQGLMQDLLSGKVRTTDADMDIPREIAQHE